MCGMSLVPFLLACTSLINRIAISFKPEERDQPEAAILRRLLYRLLMLDAQVIHVMGLRSQRYQADLRSLLPNTSTHLSCRPTKIAASEHVHRSTRSQGCLCPDAYRGQARSHHRRDARLSIIYACVPLTLLHRGGIGKATAQLLAARGVHLALHFRSSVPAAEELAASLAKTHGVRARAYQCDLGDFDAVRPFCHNERCPVC